eukprot:gene3793-4143_t
MGIAELKRGNNSQAQRAFEQAVRSDATFAEAHNKLAALYQSDKRYSECIDEANEALKFMPHHYGARLGLALGYDKLGETKKSMESLKEVLKLHPWAANKRSNRRAHPQKSC